MDAIENLEINTTRNRKVESYTARKGEFNKCILLFSGGLDTSCMLKWIQEKYGCDVYTLTIDVGQEEDFKKVEKKAYKLGSKKHFTLDCKKEFLEGFCWAAVKANALAGRNSHPISSSLTRPLMIKKMVEIAQKEGISVLAHGASGKANDSLRFDNTAMTLWPEIKIIAPVREWGMTRQAELEYAKTHGIEVAATADRPYSIDDNIWGREIESGVLDNTDIPVPDGVYSVKPASSGRPEQIMIYFSMGVPAKINGVSMSPIQIVRMLNEAGRRNGVGVFDFVEDRGVGVKVRELHESPAAAILIKSHIDLEELILTKEELRMKRIVEMEWVNEALHGFWFTPLMRAMSAFIDNLNRRVTGEITLALHHGNAVVVSRSSPYALDVANLINKKFIREVNQAATPAFIEVSGLQRRASQWMYKRAENENKRKRGK